MRDFLKKRGWGISENALWDAIKWVWEKKPWNLVAAWGSLIVTTIAAVLGKLAQLPGYKLLLLVLIVLVLCLCVIAITALIIDSRREWRLGREQQQIGPKTEGLTEKKEIIAATTLRKSLEAHFCEHANTRIRFMTMQQHLLAERIAAVFKLTRWEIDLISVPMEPIMRRSIQGLEITGPNRALVEGVATALAEYGLKSIITSIMDLPPDHPDNLKWRRIERRVEITVGYQSSGTS